MPALHLRQKRSWLPGQASRLVERACLVSLLHFEHMLLTLLPGTQMGISHFNVSFGRAAPA